jgi:hypothetical protein
VYKALQVNNIAINHQLEIYMSKEISTENHETTKPLKPKGVPIGRLTLSQIDAALLECDKTIKAHSETVKAKLPASVTIPTSVLRELSRANTQRSRLVQRRITLLIESGDGPTMELIDKLLKLKPSKQTTI